MATAVVDKPACEAPNFVRAAADAYEKVAHAAHEARVMKTIAADAVEERVYEAAHRIRKHPLAWVGLAFAVGVPMGALIGWACGHRARPRPPLA